MFVERITQKTWEIAYFLVTLPETQTPYVYPVSKKCIEYNLRNADPVKNGNCFLLSIIFRGSFMLIYKLNFLDDKEGGISLTLHTHTHKSIKESLVERGLRQESKKKIATECSGRD